jgi:hypothetical protein
MRAKVHIESLYLFGCVTSQLKNFEVDNQFINCSKKKSISRFLYDEPSIEFATSKRTSDSGMRLEADPERHQELALQRLS